MANSCNEFNNGTLGSRGDSLYAVASRTGTIAINNKDDGTDGTPGSGYSDQKMEGTNAGC